MKQNNAVVAVMICLIASVGAAKVAELSLPAIWRVKLDPGEVGVKEKWFTGDLKEKNWRPISTHDWEGWDKQGLSKDVSFGWYRVEYQIPGAMQKKHVYLYFSAVDEEVWAWVNGQSVGEHTLAGEGLVGSKSKKRGRFWITPFSFEIKKFLKFDAMNQFTVRVRKGGGAGGGIWKPVHMFAADEPLSLNQMTKRAKTLNTKILQAKEPQVRYDVWTTYPYDPIFPDSEGPGRDSHSQPAIRQEAPSGSLARSFAGSIEAEGACGEFIPIALQVGNRGRSTLAIRLDFANVRHEKYHLLLRADRVEVRFVDYILTKLKQIVPDPLPRTDSANSIRIGPGKTGSFFVLINTRGMPAGRWKGHVRLTPLLAGPTLEIPFELKIAPVVLPDRMPIWITMWSYAPHYGWGTEGRGNNQPYFGLMRRTGVNVVQMSYRDGAPLPLLNDQGELVGMETVKFDQMLVRRKFTDQDLLVLGLTMHTRNTGRWGKSFMSEKWKRNFVKYLKMVVRHIRDNHGLDYDRWALYLTDENIGDFFVSVAKLTREADPKIRIWANRIEDLETTKKAEPYIDIFVPYSPWLSGKGRGFGRYPDSEKLMDGKGKPWWAYYHSWWRGKERTAYPRAMPDAPHNTLRKLPWLAWKLRLDGFGYWVYTAPRWWERYDGFPGVAPKGPFTNVGFIYMGHDGPITSRRLEAYRDGMEDYKLLWTVDQAAEAVGQDSQLVQKAREHIKSAVDDEMAKSDQPDVLLGWRRTLLEDAAALCSAVPLDVKITEVTTTTNTAKIKLTASKPVRVWTWLEGQDQWQFIDPSRETTTPTVEIPDLVPGQKCTIILVVGGPQGRQKVLVRKFTTKPW